MTSTITLNLTVAAIIMLLFPLLRWLFPIIYSPLHYQMHVNTGIWGELFWFVDVFLQPLSVFAQRGNMTLMFVVLQLIFLFLFIFIAILSVLILLPTYYFGHDQYRNQTYLTFWSKLSLTHLEEGSVQIFIPLLVMVLICAAVMFAYA